MRQFNATCYHKSDEWSVVYHELHMATIKELHLLKLTSVVMQFVNQSQVIIATRTAYNEDEDEKGSKY